VVAQAILDVRWVPNRLSLKSDALVFARRARHVLLVNAERAGVQCILHEPRWRIFQCLIELRVAHDFPAPSRHGVVHHGNNLPTDADRFR